MNIEELRNHCLVIEKAEECTPFGDDVLVYKIMGKMFAYFSLAPKDGRFAVNLKCDPERTVELRERYEGVRRGIHSAASLLWNAIYIESDVPDNLIVELISHSRDEVVKKLPKKKREEYAQ